MGSRANRAFAALRLGCCCRLVLRLVGVSPVGRDAASARDVHSLAACPFPDGLVLLPIHPSGGAVATAAASRSLAGTQPAGGLDITGERTTEFGGVLRGKVDLIARAVQREVD